MNHQTHNHPSATSHSLSSPQAISSQSLAPSNHLTTSSVSPSHSESTFILSNSPMKARRSSGDNPRPRILKAGGQKPSCLVNASATYVGNNQIYAFGGFDQYSDEVFNHVLRLDLNTLQWTLVDNYGDIPGVRMGHTACLWQGDKVLIHGGENEHREYLSDVIVFDIKTAHWTLPDVRGPIPKGRARHAATIYDDKMFILGGLTGVDSYTLDEICFLDLKTWTWSRSWSFVPRFDHTAWVWGGRMWVYGGIGADMEKNSELWWLDLKTSPIFRAAAGIAALEAATRSSNGRSSTVQHHPHTNSSIGPGSSTHQANSSSIQVRTNTTYSRPPVPSVISSIKFVSGPSVPSTTTGTHFYAYSSGALLDFVTTGNTLRSFDAGLSALELDGTRWQKLAEGNEIFDPNYRWSYCTVSEDGTRAWLLGNNISESEQDGFDYLSDILPIDLRRYGLLGNDLSREKSYDTEKMPASDRHVSSNLGALGADLVGMFDQPPESGMGSDFAITAEREDDASMNGDSASLLTLVPTTSHPENDSHTSPPIHVHKLILQARWPHFNRLYAAQMAEFHTKKMHVPEPYSVVRAFLYYLYTDSIAKHDEYCPSLTEVAGMLVMSNIYDMPRLRLLCVYRLSRELDIESAAVVWERASIANEEWLKRRAANYCMLHWGRLVRTEGFRSLSPQSIVELCAVVDVEGRVLRGEELEVIGGLGGANINGGMPRNSIVPQRSRDAVSARTFGEDLEDLDGDEDEDMTMG